MATLRAETVPGGAGTNRPASGAPGPRLWGAPPRIDKAVFQGWSDCIFCNRHKGPNLSGLDPATRELTRLYNPRQDRWREHFAWQRAVLIGLTAVGRTTIRVLAINDPLEVAAREMLIAEGRFPPK